MRWEETTRYAKDITSTGSITIHIGSGDNYVVLGNTDDTIIGDGIFQPGIAAARWRWPADSRLSGKFPHGRPERWDDRVNTLNERGDDRRYLRRTSNVETE